jgi:probable HAF family extracellular repeat protein
MQRATNTAWVRSKPSPQIGVFCLVIAFWLPSVNANAQTSNLIDLGVATGNAINNAGQLVLGDGIYFNGTLTPLPALPGQTTPAVGAAINASGQVAGAAETSVPNPPGADTVDQVPVIFSNGTLTNLYPSLTPGIGVIAFATGINSGGQVVGYYTLYNPHNIDQPDTIGFIYTNGTFNNLPTSGQYPPIDMPSGINDSGQITGAKTVQDPNSPGNNRFDAYIYDYAAATTTDLGQGAGYGINVGGQVTGTLDIITVGDDTDTIVGSYAFLYSNGSTTNLGTLPGGKYSTGYAINAGGQVVGSSQLAGSSTTHAFFYNGAMNDLNALIAATDPLKPYVTLTVAVGISDSLLILANGVDSRTNLTHAYLYQASFFEVAPAALNFASQAVGGTSPSQSVTLSNAGTTAIPLGTASVSGNFLLTSNNCSTSLAAGGRCTIAIAFAPAVIGVLTGALTIPSAGANYQVPLSGLAPITATISASSSTAKVGMPLKITWTSSPDSTCTAADSSLNAAFNGNIPPSGSKILTEIAPGTVYYGLHCTAPGIPEVDPVTSVVWTWPAVSVTLSASPTTITAGQSTTLTWNSTHATSCTATGGGPSDQWAGAKATSGSQTVTEAFAPVTSSVVLTYGITCTSTTSGLSGAGSASVTENSSTTSKSGGGAMDLLSIFALLGIFGMHRVVKA